MRSLAPPRPPPPHHPTQSPPPNPPPPYTPQGIMNEVELLRALNHKNIVKYIGSFKTKTHLVRFGGWVVVG